MHYRKDIDGLRALAVLPVILFHGGFEWLSGGYIGVDIFFVISGYLITSIILKEHSAGNFSLLNFYERRVRRILPALFFVLFACLPFAWFWLLPHELENFGESLLAVNVFSSNILFWQESGYFAPDAELIPLLHTWSLAVEEQFYVIFPLIIMLFWRFGKGVLISLISVIALMSLGIAEWGWREFPDANFYLIPSRAWELMLGSLSAFYLYYYADHLTVLNRWIYHIASLFGLSLIFYALLAFDKTIPFPSLYALLPTLGAVLIILFSQPNTLVYRFLALKPMVGIGLISYSAYLWHFPLFVFAKIYYMDELSILLIGLLSLMALVMGYLSWRFIERPFRNKHTFTRIQIFSFSAAISLLLMSIGFFLLYSEGAMFRYS
jgi:peptidoglycan/LPS O-acetylase OafA/YrhL